MAGTVDNEDRVATAAAMYGGEASAEDYVDLLEDVMGGGGRFCRGRRHFPAMMNDGNGGTIDGGAIKGGI